MLSTYSSRPVILFNASPQKKKSSKKLEAARSRLTNRIPSPSVYMWLSEERNTFTVPWCWRTYGIQILSRNLLRWIFLLFLPTFSLNSLFYSRILTIFTARIKKKRANAKSLYLIFIVRISDSIETKTPSIKYMLFFWHIN